MSHDYAIQSQTYEILSRNYGKSLKLLQQKIIVT